MLIKFFAKKYPRTFYRYILAEVMKPFFGAAVFFLFVLMMFQVIRLADFFVVHKVSGFSILTLMSYLALTFTPIIIPIAFLLAVLLGFGRLSTDGEITAMRAAGLSIYSMLTPVVSLSVVIFIISLFCNLYFVPFGAKKFRYELFRISNTKAIATIHEGTFTEGFFDLVLYADSVDSRNNTLEKVLIYDERKKQSPVTVVAKTGKIFSNYQDAKGVPGLLLRLFEGGLHRSTPEKHIYELTQFDSYDIFLRIESAKVVGVEVPKTMDLAELRTNIRSFDGLKQPLAPWEAEAKRNLETEVHKRFSLSFTCIIFAIMGVAFGVIRTRTVRSNSFLICLLVLLFYWCIYSVGMNWAVEGKVPPAVGMWSANVILAAIAIFSIKRVAAH